MKYENQPDSIEVSFGRNDFARLRSQGALAISHPKGVILFRHEDTVDSYEGSYDTADTVASLCTITEDDIDRLDCGEVAKWFANNSNDVRVTATAKTINAGVSQ